MAGCEPVATHRRSSSFVSKATAGAAMVSTAAPSAPTIEIRSDIAAQVQRVWFRHRRVRDGVTVADDVSHISMRWFHRFELEHLLARSGFAIEAVYGGFDRRPYDAAGEIVVVARAAGARAADRLTA